MPVAVAGAALSGGLAAASGATVLGLTGAALGVAVFGANIALSGLSLALQKKPKAPDFGNFSSQASNRQLTVRQPIAEHRLVIGEIRVGGLLVYIGQTENKKYLHYVVVLAAHEVAGIGTLFFDDYPVFEDDLDGSGNVVTGKYANKIRIKKYLGTADQAADSDLVSESSDWTTDHRLRGRAYVYVRYEDDSGTFPGDIPPPSAMVRGAKLYDTRTDATLWSPNPALATRWYQSSRYGYLTPASGWDDDYTDAAANVCDEFVDTLAVDYDVDAVDVSDDALDLVAAENDILKYQTGDRVEVSSDDTLPSGISAATSYYVIIVREKARDDKTLRIRLASSYANALAGTPIDITDAGAGTITVSKTGEPRYTANGEIDTAEDPDQVIPKLLSAMGGLNVRSVSGTWRLQAAAYTAPTITYDIDDLTAPFTPKLRLSARERVNGVHGVYSSPLNNWQPHDYPVVSSEDYEEEDARYRDTFTVDAGTDVITLTGAGGWYTNIERIRFQTTDTLPAPLTAATTYFAIRTGADTMKVAETQDDALAGTAIDITDTGTGTHTVVRLDRILDELDLAFTTRPNTAQRLASIKLRKSRNEINVPVKLNLTGFLEQTGGTVGFDYDRFGWSGKPFEVAEWKCFVENNEEGVPVIGTSMIWREISSSAFDFNPANDEVAVAAAPRTTLAAAGDVAAPTALVLTSGTSVLDERTDGTIFSRLKASWTAPADQYVISGGRIEVQYKKSAASDWIDAAAVPGAATETYILDVKDGVTHDVRIRSVNSAGAVSDWVTSTDHLVVGKTEDPTDVAALSVQQSGVNVNFTWSPITDVDLAIYEIRFMQAPFVWSDARECASAPRGRVGTTAAVPPSPTDADGVQIPWVFGIKARDTSGNYSDAAATKSLTVVNPQEVVSEIEQWPLWSNRYQGWAIETAKDTGNTAAVGDFKILAVSSDGEKAYGLSDSVGDFVQYSLTTPFDISSAEPDLVSASPLVYVTLGIGGEISDPDDITEIRLSADGTEVYVSEAISNTNRIYQYTLSSPWDFSTASYTDNSGVLSGVGLLQDFVISPDGTKVVLLDSTVYLKDYPLGTPFDITTISFSGTSVNVNTVIDGDPDSGSTQSDFEISADGRTLIIAHDDGADRITQLLFGTAWDISTLENIGVDKDFSSFVTGGINYMSADAAGANLYVKVSGSVVRQFDLSSMLIRNPLTGNLNPASTVYADGDDFDVFDNYVDSPVSKTIYPAAEVDIGKDVSTRIWADVQAYLGPGETGNADAEYQVDYRKAADDYDGFQPWTVGEVTTRYVKNRVVIDQTSGVAGMKRFRPTVDAEERTERDDGVAVASGGTAVVFDTPFVNPPFLRVWNDGNDGNTAGFTSLSATGFTAFSYDGSSPDDGTIRWEATGV